MRMFLFFASLPSLCEPGFPLAHLAFPSVHLAFPNGMACLGAAGLGLAWFGGDITGAETYT